MAKSQHWTAESSDALAHKAAFDFIAQIEKRLEASEVNQVQLASKLGITEGAVSKMLNSPQNLTLKTIAKYSRALGIKFAIVAYDDNDPENENGLVSAEIFATCWYRAGKPYDMWSLNAQQQRSATKGTIYLEAGTLSLLTGATFEEGLLWRNEFRPFLPDARGRETIVKGTVKVGAFFLSPKISATGA